MLIRIRASLIHLTISFVLVSCVIVFMLAVCYPYPYFKIIGVGKLLLLLAVTDICVGPLITLVIFNPQKKWLRLELAFVALLQFAALAYGAGTIFAGRPAYLIFDENGFSLVSAYQIPQTELPAMGGKFLPMTGPKIFGARIPTNKEQRRRFISEALKYHVDLPRMPQFYVPYTEMTNDVKGKMKPLSVLLKRQAPEKFVAAKAALDDAVTKSRHRPEELAFVPMTERDENLTVLVIQSDARIVDILGIDPYGG
jgi:hypothetical protein